MRSMIGFMQGRLCDQINCEIQAFPVDNWEKEFPLAQKLGIPLIEWVVDQRTLDQNPLMTAVGRARIKELLSLFDLDVNSLTDDSCMQAPFWKADREDFLSLSKDFLNVCYACSEMGIELVVVPLVDNGSLENDWQRSTLISFLQDFAPKFRDFGLKIVFESDMPPQELAEFISAFPNDVFGLNYDIGNSASLGFAPEEEFQAYRNSIKNIHVKDRILNGTTVELGSGNADFESVFLELALCKYNGNFILQTARSEDGRHVAVMNKYIEMTQSWISQMSGGHTFHKLNTVGGEDGD